MVLISFVRSVNVCVRACVCVCKCFVCKQPGCKEHTMMSKTVVSALIRTLENTINNVNGLRNFTWNVVVFDRNSIILKWTITFHWYVLQNIAFSINLHAEHSMFAVCTNKKYICYTDTRFVASRCGFSCQRNTNIRIYDFK